MERHPEEKSFISLCKKGEREACGSLYKMHVERIYRFIAIRAKDKDIAEDISSETFMKAFRNIENFDEDRPLLPWLYRIAENSLIDYWRKEKPSVSIDDAWDIASNEKSPAEESDYFILKDRVKELLLSLSPLERDIVTLRLWDDLPYREISLVVDKTEAHTKVIFARALEKLRHIPIKQ